MRRPRLARLLLTLTGPLVLAACGGDGPTFGAPEPAAREGESILGLWQGFFVAGAVVAALMWGLIGYTLVRYRQRAGDETIPSQHAYNIRLEVLYTVTPILIVIGLFGFSYVTQRDVTDAREPEVVVEVVGFQWQWRFTYVNEGIELVGTPEGGPPELVVPVGSVVRFDLIARDVVHSFWVPSFLEKRDLIPGVDNELFVTPTRVGTYVGRCAEFCGLDHWRMNFSVRVVEQAEYDAWVAAS